MADKAIPILPARSLDETLAFYGQLGFTVRFRQDQPGPYAIVERGKMILHFFGFPTLRPEDSYAGFYIRTADVDAIHAEWQMIGLAAAGIPRLSDVENRPWGMREFHLIDPNGTLVRVGTDVRAEGRGNG